METFPIKASEDPFFKSEMGWPAVMDIIKPVTAGGRVPQILEGLRSFKKAR
jgi:hypothetical protein